jgi:hypothetical protein
MSEAKVARGVISSLSPHLLLGADAVTVYVNFDHAGLQRGSKTLALSVITVFGTLKVSTNTMVSNYRFNRYDCRCRGKLRKD